MKDGAIYKATDEELGCKQRIPQLPDLINISDGMNASFEEEPIWYKNRLVATGPNSRAFQRDFLDSYKRTKGAEGENCALMDGVFNIPEQTGSEDVTITNPHFYHTKATRRAGSTFNRKMNRY